GCTVLRNTQQRRGTRAMNWSRVGRALVQMDVDSLKLVLDAWPDFDRRYYEQAEQVYQRWLSEMREAGIVSPTGVVISLVWLYGLLWARLPRPLRWAAMLVTLVWVAGALRAGARTPDMPAQSSAPVSPAPASRPL